MRKIKKLFSILLLIALLFIFSGVFSVETTASSSYYSTISTTSTGSTLKSSLRKLITQTHTYLTTYDDCKNVSYVKKTDGDPNNSSKIILFWSNLSINAVWDGGVSWNREHVWPQSKAWYDADVDKTGAVSDMHHIRPVDKSVNSSHNNYPYGIVTDGKYVSISSTNGGGTTGAKIGGGYYEPSDDRKGDTARIIFYLLTRYSESDSYPITNVAQSMDLLLSWHNSDPVDSSETRRNEAVYGIQGNRNPYIDNPEYADRIWDENYVPGTGDDSSGGSNSGSESGTASDTLPTTDRLAKFDFGEYDSSKTNEDGQDGSSVSSYSETDGEYTLYLSNASAVYKGAYDGVGNSCLKIGKASTVGTFSFSVPSNVNKVVISVAGYKSNNASITINNGASQTISTYSSSGQYTNVTVDTSSIKTVVFATTTSGYRCKINSIGFYGSAISTPDTPITPSYTVSQAITEFQEQQTKASLYLDYTHDAYVTSSPISYSYKFESKTYSEPSILNLNGVDWELEANKGTGTNNVSYYHYNSTKGQMFGSSNDAADEVILRTDEIMDNVTQVTVSASGANGTDAQIAVYVGTKRMGTIKQLTNENDTYSFSSTTPLRGRIKIRIYQDSDVAIYVKKITFKANTTQSYEIFDLNNAAMRFGTCIDKNLYETLKAAGATWGVEYYKGTVTNWNSVQGTKIACTPAQVNQMGDNVVNTNGNYYQYALVLNGILLNNIDTQVSARAYVIVDGVTYYMSSTTYSLRTLASAYVSQSSSSYSQHLGMLTYIKNY